MTKTVQTAKKCSELDARVIGFSECGYYNSGRPAKLDTKRYQLRRASAGGDGYVFIQDFDDASEALETATLLQSRTKTCNYDVFDVSGVSPYRA